MIFIVLRNLNVDTRKQTNNCFIKKGGLKMPDVETIISSQRILSIKTYLKCLSPQSTAQGKLEYSEYHKNRIQ